MLDTSVSQYAKLDPLWDPHRSEFAVVLLIVALDQANTKVSELPTGPLTLAALFQAALGRHTGTSAFNLADVNPAVQFALLVMMYFAILPVAFTVRASDVYEEQSQGIYQNDTVVGEDQEQENLHHGTRTQPPQLRPVVQVSRRVYHLHCRGQRHCPHFRPSLCRLSHPV